MFGEELARVLLELTSDEFDDGGLSGVVGAHH